MLLILQQSSSESGTKEPNSMIRLTFTTVHGESQKIATVIKEVIFSTKVQTDP